MAPAPRSSRPRSSPPSSGSARAWRGRGGGTDARARGRDGDDGDPRGDARGRCATPLQRLPVLGKLFPVLLATRVGPTLGEGARAMPPQVVRAGPSLIDVFDRVLDKGIVIDAWVRVSLVGIELVTVDARVVVASIATYFEHSDALAELPTQAAPARRVSAAGASAAPPLARRSRTAERRRANPRALGAAWFVALMKEKPTPLERTCPKCGRDVTDQDHQAKNAELAPPRAEGRSGGGMVQACQHNKCPTGT